MKFKAPMLAATLDDLAALDTRRQWIASPKLDGIRCVIEDRMAYSRNGKPIRNRYVQSMLSDLPSGLDGELIVGMANAPDVFKATTEGVMSTDGRPDFRFHVFDTRANPQMIFRYRIEDARRAIFRHQFTRLVPHTYLADTQQITEYEARTVRHGFEGIMLRDANGAYKFGRSTLKEGGLLKVKRWMDAEAVVIGFVERMHNSNAQTRDELGRAKRSKAKGGMVGTDTLGALVCRFDNGVEHVEFEIGTGFDDATRAAIWRKPVVYKKRKVKFKFQALTEDGIPRFPVFLGFRHGDDA